MRRNALPDPCVPPQPTLTKLVVPGGLLDDADVAESRMGYRAVPCAIDPSQNYVEFSLRGDGDGDERTQHKLLEDGHLPQCPMPRLKVTPRTPNLAIQTLTGIGV